VRRRASCILLASALFSGLTWTASGAWAMGPASAAEAPGASSAPAPLPAPPSATSSSIAAVIYRTVPRAAPSAAARGFPTIFPVARWGTPTVLLVLGAHRGPGGEWLRVLLDERPNGTAVWINARDTLLRRDRWRIVVSRARRRVAVFRDDRRVRSFSAVVGKPSTPTPAGLFAIAAELRQPDANEFEGTWVLPLTAHSDVLREFDGGDGQVALHGRGGASLLDPLGTARSHGCVRLANSAIGWIAAHVPAGTPVRVR
jgi:lipoprotein-anchoring transpeptidase ErfK/SrfK